MKSVARTIEPVATEREARFDQIKPYYLEALTLVERLHRRLLDVIKDEFDRRGRADINAVQALLLYNIGDKELTAGELRTRGYYLGSNVSYNVKKMVENGYLGQERSPHDRRSVRVRLSDKGLDLRDKISSMFERQVKALDKAGLNDDELIKANETMRKLERFWSSSLDYSGYPVTSAA
jgi:DNA-binding MarR family transcriptional regulator